MKFNSTLTEVGDVPEIGTVWRYEISSGSYNYTSRVSDESCLRVDGTRATAPCGKPGLDFVDEDLESYFLFSCKSSDVTICDGIIKSASINAVVGSACGGGESCI